MRAGHQPPGTARPPRFMVTEIYRSVSGESTRAGEICTLVRLTGCGLRCVWCDTAYAFTGGTPMALDAIIARVRELGAGLVLVTGGEPLEQDGVDELLRSLTGVASAVMVETGGHVDIGRARAATSVILDIKAPASGMMARNRWENLDLLRPADEVKIVLADRSDFDWACAVLSSRRSRGRALVDVCPVLFSPAWGRLDAAVLAKWILAEHLPVRLNLQIHKILWPHATRGV
ncbi:MAG: radical SAM protein [Acidobacteriota bacterium]